MTSLRFNTNAVAELRLALGICFLIPFCLSYYHLPQRACVQELGIWGLNALKGHYHATSPTATVSCESSSSSLWGVSLSFLLGLLPEAPPALQALPLLQVDKSSPQLECLP